MGVTPDLLKHYEDQGLLWAEHRENGYRYYPFQTSPKFLAAMQLKSYGIPIRGMQALISDASPEELLGELKHRTAHMEKEAERLRMVIEEQRSLEAWMARRRPGPDDWEVTDFESFCFLPHSHGLVFIENEDIYKILPDWLGWMPLVKSTLAVTPAPAEDGTLPLAGIHQFYRGGSFVQLSDPRNERMDHGCQRRNGQQLLHNFVFVPLWEQSLKWPGLPL